jgi:hypothetical protein
LSKSCDRKAFFAREDLLKRLSAVAKERGCSLYELVNEIFELAVACDSLGSNLKMAVDSRRELSAAKGAGFVLGLENLWYEMTNLAFKKDKRAVLKSWFDAGVWFATRYVSGDGDVPLLDFRGDLVAFTWNAPELKLINSGNKVSLSVTSPRFTESYTVLFAAFLEGALKAFGFKVIDKEVSRGVIRLESVREDVVGPA